MKIDPHYIIKSCENYANQHYREGSDPADRLAYQVGLLNAKVIELCNYIENSQDEIKQLQLDIIQLKGEQ